jgi:FKBP12-rapamycin complex-associated protein
MQKLELFRCGAALTKGDDLAAMLWRTSPSAETWLGKRITYTRSLAVMSMVGRVATARPRKQAFFFVVEICVC